MSTPISPISADLITRQVADAIAEDLGSGDITASLLPEDLLVEATVVSREAGVLCGAAWAHTVFTAIDERCDLNWLMKDGATLAENDVLFSVSGPARALMTAERTALNFLQTLSGTASTSAEYAALVRGTGVKLLDTRKTIPGLRLAQKYAVRCGGCFNHRIGLFDAFLIKENHIAACGSLHAAVLRAREIAPGTTVEVEVENVDQLALALDARCERIMLDNFDLPSLREAVRLTAGAAALEASGNVDRDSLREVAETGVDYISIGALTKHCRALDLSMRVRD
ncbi:MAG: carboxylating nicotinate-nucleotide diphosphorylase [Pseudomonadota bacterium]